MMLGKESFNNHARYLLLFPDPYWKWAHLVVHPLLLGVRNTQI